MFDATAFIRRSAWIFAKTMPEIPHEYTVRGRTAASDEEFFEMVRHIRENGYVRPWGRYRNTYLEIPDDSGVCWRYWTMGNPVEETTIINRERCDEPWRG